MSFIQSILNRIMATYSNKAVSTVVILSVLLVVLLLALYEFIVYRVVSHRAFYNRSFNISITVLPFFIATIILCLQSNLVITLGTIGALAIIRYRTAVKDPVDMLYLLWSIHIGICCGCQLYEVAVLTSLLVTIVLLIMENLCFAKRPYVLVLHTDENDEDTIKSILGECTKNYRVKSRNFTGKGMDYAIEFSSKEPQTLTKKLQECEKVSRFSVIEYDAEDIL